ncbi:MAG: hypothetical protein CVU99_09075 [Firmicutes bacterium HGW-Firmicutes-4]|nr:MAG: hypothetical protein CVV25_13395 [Ignavibacteriae bacterium HGW-Ignavibacteriae-4]PKM60248.1 MAG: hypothetical protein CVU99_09075 [Firmicutes bacterium HGW-Firmicutes-4]
MRLELAAGTGRTYIYIELIDRLLKKEIIHKTLILADHPSIKEQFLERFISSTSYLVSDELNTPVENQIVVATYDKLCTIKDDDFIKEFDLIICDNAQKTNNDNIKKMFLKASAMFVGIFPIEISKELNKSWFSEEESTFSYSIELNKKEDILVATRSTQQYARDVEEFCVRLFQQYKYDVKREQVLNIDSRRLSFDLILSSEEDNILIEIKAYRSRHTPINVIDTAIGRMLRYKSLIENNIENEITLKYTYFLILFCEIDHQQKKDIFEQNGIAIWDIANLLYICDENSMFLQELSELASFQITDIIPEKPYGWRSKELDVKFESIGVSGQTTAESLEEKLLACKTGKANKASEEYENICTDIIRFLFESEFTQISDQHKTSDNLFRMDLLCGIKGSSEFWKCLIRHYNSRFVVFEYKNYCDKLSQNLIYITEKYLFNTTLRNVAIIVSRKGFSPNANIAALGCLRESGKLIIDLTDQDLISMLHMKTNGEEPSDFLLWKLEKLLMSVSK